MIENKLIDTILSADKWTIWFRGWAVSGRYEAAFGSYHFTLTQEKAPIHTSKIWGNLSSEQVYAAIMAARDLPAASIASSWYDAVKKLDGVIESLRKPHKQEPMAMALSHEGNWGDAEKYT